MKKHLIQALLAVALLAFLFAPGIAQAQKPSSDIAKLTAGMPRDVARFIARRVECNRWDEIEVQHLASQGEINAAQLRFRCDGLEWEEKKLRRKHARQDLVLKRIDMADAYS